MMMRIQLLYIYNKYIGGRHFSVAFLFCICLDMQKKNLHCPVQLYHSYHHIVYNSNGSYELFTTYIIIIIS